MLDWLVEKREIAPHIPVIDKSGRKDGTFERADFTYDAENDLYICPKGKDLKQYRRAYKTPRSGANKDETVRYYKTATALPDPYKKNPIHIS